MYLLTKHLMQMDKGANAHVSVNVTIFYFFLGVFLQLLNPLAWTRLKEPGRTVYYVWLNVV